jgi:ubiquinone/menaquinone biosynthesis C-methylase UbiE
MPQLPTATQVSQAYFNPLLLTVYDQVLYNGFTKYFWRYPKEKMIQLYRDRMGTKHADVGVGTGYVIDKANPESLDLTLLDLSKACLDKAAKRLARYSPKTAELNLLEPIQLDDCFDSISLNFVMHCVAGDFNQKGVAFEYLKPLLKPQGVLFGTTIIKDERTPLHARGLLTAFNAIGLFNNAHDQVSDLESALYSVFK